MFSVKLYNDDCANIFCKLEDRSMDAVVTDPPFGIDFGYDEHKDVANSPEEYWKWLFPFYTEILKKIKPGGFLSIWQSTPYFQYFWTWFGNDIRIYIGAKNFVQLRKTPINYGYDPIIMKYIDGEPLRPQKPKRNLDFFVANTAKWIRQTDSLARKHPCPRPIDQAEEIIKNFVVEKGTVFDPFMGSGTIGVACVLHNRNYIGIEIRQKYFEIAKERISKAIEEKNDTR